MNTSEELKDLEKLLNFGASCLEKQEIHVLKLRAAKKMFFSMFVAAHNYTEAIHVLCRENRSHACLNLLRSLWENLINAKFLYCNPHKHYHMLTLVGFTEKRKQLNQGIEFHIKNPQAYIPNEYSVEKLRKKLTTVDKEIRKLKEKIAKYQGGSKLSIADRTQLVDKHNKNKNLKSESLERIYFLIYRTLSSSTHLNILSLCDFFTIENGEIVVLLSGNPDDTNLIVHNTSFLYKEMLRQFFKIFKGNPLQKDLKKI